MLIITCLYIQWTKGNPAEITGIEGIQGRYFMLVIPALLIGILPTRMTSGDKETHGSICVMNNIMIIYTALSLAVVSCIVISSSFAN